MTTTAADNILAVYARATDSEREHGTDWYRDAHAIAADIADGDVWRGAGVIAALSPRVRWDINIRNARRAFETGTVTGHTKVMCAQAQRILDGENALDVLKGDKVRAFCAAIATAGESDIATIDRHALEIALGKVYSDKERPTIGKRVYREMAAAYAIAAESVGISVNAMQAITWVVWRREKGIVVA